MTQTNGFHRIDISLFKKKIHIDNHVYLCTEIPCDTFAFPAKICPFNCFLEVFYLSFISFFSLLEENCRYIMGFCRACYFLQPSICSSLLDSCILPIQVVVEKDGFEMEVNRMACSAKHIFFPSSLKTKNNFLGGGFFPVATFAVQWTKTEGENNS